MSLDLRNQVFFDFHITWVAFTSLLYVMPKSGWFWKLRTILSQKYWRPSSHKCWAYIQRAFSLNAWTWVLSSQSNKQLDLWVFNYLLHSHLSQSQIIRFDYIRINWFGGKFHAGVSTTYFLINKWCLINIELIWWKQIFFHKKESSAFSPTCSFKVWIEIKLK